jgi:hypothetical protein
MAAVSSVNAAGDPQPTCGVESEFVGQERCEALHPAEDGNVVDLDTALEQQFLNKR